MNRMPRLWMLVATLPLVLQPVQAATTDLVGKTAWTALLKGARFDYYADTQAQKAGTEIVGNATHASMYFNYDDNGTSGTVSDDVLSLRIRIGDETKSSHSAYIFVGIDANNDGVLDAFISSGSGNIGIWDPGSGSNTSPNTTTIAGSPAYSYANTASNYNFAVVSTTNDGDWDGNNDINTDSKTDVFVSFAVPIVDLAAKLATHSITFTDTTPLRFVSLTATQTNSLNSDFNGVDDGTLDDWNMTFQQLGLFSSGVTSNGIVDTTPPQAPTVDSQTTSDTTPVITGTYDAADAAGGFQVTVNSVTYTPGDGNLSVSGNVWSLQIPAGNALSEGTYNLTAHAADGAGNAIDDATSGELIIDLTPPPAPTVNSQTTNDTTPLITGTYDASDAAGGLQVTVNSVTYTLGDGNLSASGNTWSLQIPAGNAMTANTYSVTATVTDGAGHSSMDGSSNELVIDTTAPTAPTVVSQLTNDTTPVITGTYNASDAAGGLQVTVNGVTYTLGDGKLSASGNTWSLQIPAGNAIAAGTYSVTATATDGAGNSSSDGTGNELVIDTTPPTAPTVASQSTSDTTPLITGTFNASDAAGGLQVTVNNVTYTLGDGNLSASGNNWSLQIPAGNALAAATYNVTATATDGAGNARSDATSGELTIDTAAPTAPTVTSQVTKDTTPMITGTYDASDAAGGLQVTVDGVTYNLGDGNLSASGNTWSLQIPAGNAVGAGTYSVTATATDAVGNSSSDSTSNELIVDLTAPAVPTVTSQTTSDTTPVITGTYNASDASGGLQVTVNGVTYTLGDGNLSASGNTWTLTIPAGNALALGTYSVTATVTDAAGNSSTDLTASELVIGGDNDGDGVPDAIDLDDDNDGIPDSVEGDGVVDTDGDGIADSLDLDSDNDGLLDLVESGAMNPGALDLDGDGRIDDGNSFGANGLVDAVETAADSGQLNYAVVDSDGDGVKDFRDLDSDNDGITDVLETGGSDPDGDGRLGNGTPAVDSNGVPTGGGLPPVDTDGDGTPDQRDLDSDGDGINDITEAGGVDNDHDGKVDGFVDNNNDGYDDGLSSSPPPLPDADNDGIPDFQDKNDSDNDGITDDLDLDDDNDGIPDALEGDGNVDTDGDGVPDSRDLDSDNDGIFDLLESGAANALALDGDHDGRIDLSNDFGTNGLADIVEDGNDSGQLNYDAGGVDDSDGDGVPDFRDLDSDNDGITDVIESGGSDPDGDGRLGDGPPSVNTDGIGPGGGGTPVDSDGDGVEDFRDLDSDNDGVPDLVEAGGTDADGDGKVDGFHDADGDGLDDGVRQNPLPLLDSNNDGIPDYQESGAAPAAHPIRTGLQGFGGCSVARGAPSVDPTLAVLCILALLAVKRKRIGAVIKGRKTKCNANQ